MSWLAKLSETYENCLVMDLPETDRIMPVAHTLQNAHIHIVLDGDGHFKRASVLEKQQIVLPATEKSAGRTSGQAPHPLADKIQYVARDYPEYGGRKKSFFESYRRELADWCNSDFSHPKAVAVLKYIEKGGVVADLVDASIFFLDENKKLLAHWPYETDDNHPAPLIFKVLPKLTKAKRVEKDKAEIEPGDALVCWSVEVAGEANSATWKDQSLQQRWIDYCASTNDKEEFCYVAGENRPLSINHPAKLRHSGDKAKLISSNDDSGFTFRGRFTDKEGLQAATISFEVTQKAHNALRWLIARQGYRNGEQVFVTWAVSGKKTPDPMKSPWEQLADADFAPQKPESGDFQQQPDHGVDLGYTFARRFNKCMAGYHASLEPTEQIVIMGMDSATPGRIGIIYYQELLAGEFLDRLQRWHDEFAWPQRHTVKLPASGKKKKGTTKVVWPRCSPAPRIIAEAAYGNVFKSNEHLKKSILERILPCIVDGRSFPQDIMVAAVRQASNRHTCEPWEWERNLGVACAVYKGYYRRHPDQTKRRNYDMTLEKERTTRDYLYGRLLAIAERIEEIALNVAGEKRPTTTARLMQRFADHPFSTWRTIELGLQPYMQRLQSQRGGFLTNRKKELDMVMAMFAPDDFASDKALDGEFLLGYHCQKQFWQDQKNGEDKDNPEGENV